MTLSHLYQEAKRRHPGMLLLFRMDNYFELYGEDAEVAGRVLGFCKSLRTENQSCENHVAGFAQHLLEKNLRKLLKAGHRVAICDHVDQTRTEYRAANVPPTLFGDLDP